MAREDRQHGGRLSPPNGGGRTDGQRDHDRILYSSAFRRLANITQVVAADQSASLHNRLTHTLKVAQLGRRLAEKLLRENRDRAVALGGLDADVVEAACLAHDLGPPPFGHIAEEELKNLAEAEKVHGGFEGNAQSFRIVTKLAVRTREEPGLNLSRATLNALLKYPWERDVLNPGKQNKWGAYRSESVDLAWVRADETQVHRRSLEAEVMDFADDIAYSIYDVEDFYRAHKIPMHDLFVEDASTRDNLSEEASRFFEGVFTRWTAEGKISTPQEKREYKGVFLNMVSILPSLKRDFDNTNEHKSLLRNWTSVLVGRYINAFELQDSTDPAARRSKIKPVEQKELAILKQIIWHYVINDSGLATQQFGYRKVIRTLFQALLDSVRNHDGYMLPPMMRESLALSRQSAPKLSETDTRESDVRIVIDYIASMSEQEALALYRKLQGIAFGSFRA